MIQTMEEGFWLLQAMGFEEYKYVLGFYWINPELIMAVTDVTVIKVKTP
jgi:hypothetical protein